MTHGDAVVRIPLLLVGQEFIVTTDRYAAVDAHDCPRRPRHEPNAARSDADFDARRPAYIDGCWPRHPR
jgi:hypothetical protein